MTSRTPCVGAALLCCAMTLTTPSFSLSAAPRSAPASLPDEVFPVAQGYIKASNTDAGDLFASTLSLSEDTLVVGAPLEDGGATGVDGDQEDDSADAAGAAYVFVREGAQWAQQAYLKASNTESPDQFGISVAVSGDTVVVGAQSESSAATGVDGDQEDNSAPGSGAVYVFVRSGTSWSQQAYIKASNPDVSDTFGYSVALSDDTLVVGAPSEASGATGVDGDQGDNSEPGAGAAYVFRRTGGTWSQEAYLKASNTDSGDSFGTSVAVSGDTVVVGAWAEDSAATGVNGDGSDNSARNAGAAYVFVRSGTSWSQAAYLKALNTDADDGFGQCVSVSDGTVVIGASWEDSDGSGADGNPTDDSLTNAGAVYVFEPDGTSWTQLAYLKASNRAAGDRFGSSVAVSADSLVVGATGEDSRSTFVGCGEDDNGANSAGAAYSFVREGTSWSQTGYLKASNADSTDLFSWSITVSDGTVVVGATGEDSAATGVDGDQDDESLGNSGAAYAYVLDPSPPGTPLCFGDGTGTACPCGNDSPSAGEGCLHSGGVGMTIAGSGTTSISADDLTLTVRGVPSGNSGIFYSGRTGLGPGALLYDGLQCAGGDVRRYQGRVASFGCVCDTGFVAQDPSGIYFVPGATYYFQYWSRDVFGGPCGTGANFSPAYAVSMIP